MTPPRLNQLRCPGCQHEMWIIDSDYRGTDGVMQPYAERDYRCSACHYGGAGWTLLQQSPPAFLLQPHDLYPMTQADFDHWLAILRANFPDHARRRDFRPRVPADAIRNLEQLARRGSPPSQAIKTAANRIRALFHLK